MHPHIRATIHHLAAQFFYRWDKLPFSGETFAPPDVSSLSVTDWRELLQLEAGAAPDKVWVQALQRTGAKGFTSLALTIFKHLGLVRENGGRFITIYDQEYPELLRYIEDPPLALSVLGDLSLLSKPMVAVVGSRKSSGFAIQQTQALAFELADRGFIIVSGGAIGCDAAAHYGAHLSAVRPSPTVVVLAGGLMRFYPQRNLWLFRELIRGGAAFVSERLWWAASLSRDFPVRNRIISGMAKTVLIMQADCQSGAMITARKALDQGREVAVLRHPEGDARAGGNVQLAYEGAPQFTSSEELFGIL